MPPAMPWGFASPTGWDVAGIVANSLPEWTLTRHEPPSSGNSSESPASHLSWAIRPEAPRQGYAVGCLSLDHQVTISNPTRCGPTATLKPHTATEDEQRDQIHKAVTFLALHDNLGLCGLITRPRKLDSNGQQLCIAAPQILEPLNPTGAIGGLGCAVIPVMALTRRPGAPPARPAVVAAAS
jgi:hypothetical protein